MPSDFASALARLGLTQAEFRRFLEDLSGEKLGNVTVWRWANGVAEPSIPLKALLRLLEAHPELLDPEPESRFDLRVIDEKTAKRPPRRAPKAAEHRG